MPNGNDLRIDRLLNESEAATVLGIKRQTLAVWRSSGRYGLPFVKVGRAVRYRMIDLQTFIESRTVTTTANCDALKGNYAEVTNTSRRMHRRH